MARRRRSEYLPYGGMFDTNPQGVAHAVVDTVQDVLTGYSKDKRYQAAAEAAKATVGNAATAAKYVAQGGKLSHAAGELAKATGAWAGSALKTGAAASFATEGVKSAAREAHKMIDDVSATGGFTAEGWKNLLTVDGLKDFGKGLVGSAMDVANGMTMGAVPNGDKVRETMSMHQMQPEIAPPETRGPTFRGTVAGETASNLQSKSDSSAIDLQMSAEGATPMTPSQIDATATRAQSATRSANYWKQTELANKANSDYADGIISKEVRDQLVAQADAAKKADTGGEIAQLADNARKANMSPVERMEAKANEGADEKTRNAFGTGQTNIGSDASSVTGTDPGKWLATYNSLTTPSAPTGTSSAQGGKPSDVTGVTSRSVYERQQQELTGAPIEQYVGTRQEQSRRETNQMTQDLVGEINSLPSEVRSELLADNQQGISEDRKEEDETYGDVKGGRSRRAAEDGGEAGDAGALREALLDGGPDESYIRPQQPYDPWQLSDDETARYREYKRTGEYGTDDQVIRLRAMIPSRGRDEVRELALNLRKQRDMALAHNLAEEFNRANPRTAPSTWRDFYREYDPGEMKALYSQVASPGARNGREAFVNAMNDEIGRAVSSGDANAILDARRKAIWYARRFGFGYTAAPTSRRLESAARTVRVDPEGWMKTADPRFSVRNRTDGKDAKWWNALAKANDDEYRYDDAVDLSSEEVRRNPERYADRIVTTVDRLDRGYNDLALRTKAKGQGYGLPAPGFAEYYDGTTDFGLSLSKAERRARGETPWTGTREQEGRRKEAARRTVGRARELMQGDNVLPYILLQKKQGARFKPARGRK